MHPLFLLLRLLGPAWLAPGVLSAALVAPHREPEITGAYEDEGAIAVAPPGEPPPVVSLHALLTVQFIPGVARLLHEQTGEVRLTHTAGRLRAEITNRDGEVAWERIWRQGEDYGVQGARVVLRFKGVRPHDDDFLLLLETVTAYKLLQVEVQRLTPTLLGPRARPMGTYLFHRTE
ncbi:MAG: hypothetical protein ACOZE5_05670 [Verrucomicrobiota bacterium]